MLAVTKTLSLFRWSLSGGYVKPLVLSPLSLHISWKWTLIKNRWHCSKLLVGNVGRGVMVSLTRAVIGLDGRGEIKQGLNGLHSGPLNFDVRSHLSAWFLRNSNTGCKWGRNVGTVFSLPLNRCCPKVFHCNWIRISRDDVAKRNSHGRQSWHSKRFELSVTTPFVLL